MKELGRSTQKMLATKDRSSELLTYVTDAVQPEETNRWKSINTHTHTPYIKTSVRSFICESLNCFTGGLNYFIYFNYLLIQNLAVNM